MLTNVRGNIGLFGISLVKMRNEITLDQTAYEGENTPMPFTKALLLGMEYLHQRPSNMGIKLCPCTNSVS